MPHRPPTFFRQRGDGRKGRILKHKQNRKNHPAFQR